MENDIDKHWPVTEAGLVNFLSSSRVEGIGPVYARRIVERFGLDSLRIIRADPSLIARDVPGVGELRAESASASLKDLGSQMHFIAFLYSCCVTEIFIDRILHKYSKRAEDVVATDPYSMVEDVWQLSFFTADKIGKVSGIAPDDPRRLRGALVTAVKHFAEEGHLFAKTDEAVTHAAKIAGASPESVRDEIEATEAEGRLRWSRGCLYLPVFYNAEKECARKLSEIALRKPEPIVSSVIPDKTLSGAVYTPVQRRAIAAALNHSVVVITGQPGSGKTTVIRGIIEAMEKTGKKVVLCAPMGRAAKRMAFLAGKEATTIHRLLGYRQGEGYHKRNIKADMLIIDESSMLEQVLLNHLLQAVDTYTRIIFVGDADQLPAIGAGDVLRDLIASGVVPVENLDENFRHSEGSMIARGARAINMGRWPETDTGDDLVFIEAKGVKAIHDRIMTLIADELPASRGVAPKTILVVTPQQIGPLGARQLNIEIQQLLNPEGPEIVRSKTIFRLGDPVMQISNSPQRLIYNGETGEITEVNDREDNLEVTFYDGRKSLYHRKELGELTLAYATTVHKLQGSEVKNIIIPLSLTHRPMLYRNLIYTGVTRATDLCVLVGEADALEYALAHTPAITRNSNFRHRLSENIRDSE